MKFEVGDEVVVKHSNEDGKVVEIIDQKMVMVEVRGVRFPVYTDQLDFPYFKRFTSGKFFKEEIRPVKKNIDQVKKEKSPLKYAVAPGVWLLIFPVFNKDVFDEDIVEELKIYLVNQTDKGLAFYFGLYYQQQLEMEMNSEIMGLSDFYLVNIDFEKMNDQPEMIFEFNLVSPDKKKVDYFEAVYKPKARQVFKQIEKLKEKGESFFTHLLFEKFPDRQKIEADPVDDYVIRQLNNAGFVVRGNKKNFLAESAPPSTIDLHIEKLVEKPGSLASHEKLAIQLRAFEKWLGRVKMHMMKHGWVIHGVGSGRLRDEIHEILKHEPGIRSFANHFHPWFGSGATEIFFE